MPNYLLQSGVVSVVRQAVAMTGLVALRGALPAPPRPRHPQLPNQCHNDPRDRAPTPCATNWSAVRARAARGTRSGTRGHGITRDQTCRLAGGSSASPCCASNQPVSCGSSAQAHQRPKCTTSPRGPAVVPTRATIWLAPVTAAMPASRHPATAVGDGQSDRRPSGPRCTPIPILRRRQRHWSGSLAPQENEIRFASTIGLPAA